ncbi:MAG: glycosyltransferase family 4 protein [Pseudomonadales bacterium]
MAASKDAQFSGLLQICPNDGPPFADLCAAYTLAADSLGVRSHTVYLGPPGPGSSHDHRISYLNLKDLTHHSAAAQRLKGCNPFPNPRLTLCHRYRSYRVARVAGLPQQRSIALAHEFGMLGRWQRRLDRLLSARQLTYAGISPPVVAELEQTVSKALLLPNIIDWARLDRELLERDAARAHLGIDPERFCIGVVGRLHHKKRPQRAIAAMAALNKTQHQSELLFIGEGELRTELAELAAGLPVRFAGFQRNARKYFNGLDALLMTSSSAEAFGMVALEALAAGLPVIAPDVPGIRSVLGELGFYANAEADPESLLRGIRGAMRLGARAELTGWQAAARARVRKEFSITAAATRLEPLLQRTSTDLHHDG